MHYHSCILLLALLISLARQDCITISRNQCSLCYSEKAGGKHPIKIEECTQMIIMDTYFKKIRLQRDQCFEKCFDRDEQGEIIYWKDLKDKGVFARFITLILTLGLFLALFLFYRYWKQSHHHSMLAYLGGCLYLLLTCRIFSFLNRKTSNNSRKHDNQIELVDKSRLSQEHFWEELQFPDPKILSRNQKCSVCLKSNADTKTNCNHYFHFDCILVWTRIKKSCPECGSQNVGNVTTFCHKCCSMSATIDLGKIKKSAIEFLREDLGTQCSNCALRRSKLIY